jgi:hypothetical protein
MTLTVPGLAQADPGSAPNSVAALVADVAAANQRLQDIGAAVQAEQEGVNKATPTRPSSPLRRGSTRLRRPVTSTARRHRW